MSSRPVLAFSRWQVNNIPFSVAIQGVFYERPPYRNTPIHSAKPEHVTRFIALADFNNDAKHRVCGQSCAE